ncbi:putative phosphoglycerate mutase [Bifidobacterium commune]|uniref:phosphoglycerate mutase (2,3-diphosphoglycerate-dependent) n=1 Tax=Bifidobacterium commune TaxID=1505727 RepID=A0A1C4H6W3_9BIFI|nr:histidine phosphatase family protein [Bifidobacterium commune]MBB2955678.1 putative phosphoglycerate mutase [Bifidobacterium commune]SCC80483.1 probable phosphoglycerate mutase [Bifidobacterium commune]
MGNYLTSGDGAADPGYLVLLRHGQTPWSVSGQYTGRTDVSLTEQGRQQALAGGERLREVFPGGFSDGCVFTSPLRRASETAQLAGYAVSETLEDLAEWDYGRAEGRKREEVSAALGHDWCIWDEGPEMLPETMGGDWVCELPDGQILNVHNGHGETVDEAAVRARRVIEKAVPLILEGHNVLLVAHAHILRIVTSQWLHTDPHLGRLLRLDTAHHSVLGYYKNDPVIVRWNV